MKPLHTIVLTIAISCLGATATLAGPAVTGTITTLNPERAQWNISVDTRDLTITSSTAINNLGTPGRGNRELELRMRVRYRANNEGEITELLIYPSDREMLHQLGLDAGQNQE